jgi:hypothetical protein
MGTGAGFTASTGVGASGTSMVNDWSQVGDRDCKKGNKIKAKARLWDNFVVHLVAVLRILSFQHGWKGTICIEVK